MSFALLDLFALERSEPSFSRVQTGALAASVQKSCEYRLARQKQSLQCDVEEAAVWGEPELLRTLLLNLLDNAHKASPPGAVLQLRGRVVPSGYLFCVIDPGRGIPRRSCPTSPIRFIWWINRAPERRAARASA